MMLDFTGKTIAISGAAIGFGRAIAARFGAAGADVYGCDILDADAADAERISITKVDLRDRQAAARWIGEIEHRTGRAVDVLVCNAGIQPAHGPLSERTEADFSRTMTVNLQSMLWLSNLVIPQMAARRDGSVILMGSIAALRGNRAIGLYALSKAACVQLARNLAVEWGPHNIRVNCIAPGIIRTRFSRALWEDEKRAALFARMSPLRRLGDPDDVAGVAVLLASRAGNFITGQTLVVDGGGVIGGAEPLYAQEIYPSQDLRKERFHRTPHKIFIFKI